jgi:hypothetical protein
MNPLDAVTDAVDVLAKALPGLLEACTDPQAADMAELLLVIREARTRLYGIEQDTEHTLARAMVADQAVTGTLRVERKRGPERKAWDHDAWKRDVRQNALRGAGLLGAHVITSDGEEAPQGVLSDLLRKVQDVHGAAAPKTSAAGLRGLGLDPMDYCETSAGKVTVQVYRMADESKPTEGGESDAA